LAEQVTVNHFVVGSNPTSGAILYRKKNNFPIVFESLLPQGAVLYDKPNILEIHIDMQNSEKGLGLVDLHLK
jgi:hypothetical protein